MMDDQTHTNMMKRSQRNFAHFFPIWEYPVKLIKNKTKRIQFNLFQTDTICNKEQLLFFADFFKLSIIRCVISSASKSQRLFLKICVKFSQKELISLYLFNMTLYLGLLFPSLRTEYLHMD